jgi:hypothetical protein
MKRFSILLIISLLISIVGIAAAIVWLYVHSRPTPSTPCSLARSENKLNALEAVRLAECFVQLNGYTALPPMEDTSQLAYESLTFGATVEEELQLRHNTLESKAYGVMGGGRAEDGWTVVFRYNLSDAKFSDYAPAYQEQLKTVGRAVTMDAYGGTLRVQHQDMYLNPFQPLEDGSR